MKHESILSTNAHSNSDTKFSDLEKRLLKFWQWNGDLPVPRFSHWTPQGSVIVQAATPRISSEVLWRPKDGEARRLGYDDINPYWPMTHIVDGKYDEDAGVLLSQLVPPDWTQWNNLG